MQKGIVAAVAATMGTGIVAPVYAASAETTDLAGKYAKAYEATVNAKTQKELTEARKLVDALYAQVKGTPDEYLATTLSSLLDPVQQKELVKLDAAIKAAEASVKQADVNTARALIVDMPEVWRNAFSSYIDTIQNKLITSAVDAINAAVKSGVQADLDAAKKLYDELLTVTNNDGVKSWVETALKAELDKVVVAVKVDKVEAVGAKVLKVTFNQAVDTTKATIAVKKGTVTANVAKVTFADDKKSAQIELSSKLTEGDYTVSVAGLTTTAITGTVKAANEKVADINVLSDKAVINSTTVEVGYEVLNQYGENITKIATVNPVSSLGTVTPSPSTGKLSMPLGTAKSGDKFTLSLVNVDTAVSETVTLTIADSAQASAVAITELYHESGKTLTADESSIADYSLVVEAKDQYGNTLSASKAGTDLLVRVSDTSVVSVNGYSASTNAATFSTVKINGEDKVVLKLAGGLKAGKSTVTLISKYTGKTAAYEVTVNEGLKVNTLTLSAPELVVAGETVTIPFEATDMYGNAVTKVSKLNSDISFTISGAGTWTGVVPTFDVDSNGKTVLKVAVPSDALATTTITAITANQKFTNLAVNVKEVAKPVAIIGLDSDVYTNVLEGETLTFGKAGLIAEDQYGRKMSDSKFAGLLGDTAAPANGKYFVQVANAEPGTTGTPAVAIGAIADPSAARIGGATTTSVTVAGSVRGTEELKFSLVKYDLATTTYVPVTGSEYAASVRVVKQSDIVSYDMDNVTTLYDEVGNGKADNAAYDYTVEVFGKLANGSKVFVPATKYTITSNHVALVPTADVLDVVNVDTSSTPDGIGDKVSYGDETQVTLKATVTINATGDSIVKDVVVSKASPKVATAEFDTDSAAAAITKGDSGFMIVDTAADVNTAAEIFGFLEIEDQYEVAATIAGTGIVTFANTAATTIPATVTFSNIVNSDGDGTLSVTGNGTNAAGLNNLEAGDTFTVTVTFSNGVTASAKVVAK
jgi:hypothetical protein